MKKAQKRAKATLMRQREQIAEILVGLKPDVTARDRDAAVTFLDVTKPTISNYLNGAVMNADLGLRMIDFFKIRIEKRGTKINMLCGQSKSA